MSLRKHLQVVPGKWIFQQKYLSCQAVVVGSTQFLNSCEQQALFYQDWKMEKTSILKATSWSHKIGSALLAELLEGAKITKQRSMSIYLQIHSKSEWNQSETRDRNTAQPASLGKHWGEVFRNFTQTMVTKPHPLSAGEALPVSVLNLAKNVLWKGDWLWEARAGHLHIKSQCPQPSRMSLSKGSLSNFCFNSDIFQFAWEPLYCSWM